MTVVLNRRLVLEERGRAPDGAGGATGGWTALGEHWAAIRSGTGRIEGGEGFPRSRVPYRVTIRAVAPDSPARPKAGQRFREGERVYAILAVADRTSDARFLDCVVDEEVAS